MNKKGSNLLFFLTIFGLIASNFGCNSNKSSKEQKNIHNASLERENRDFINTPSPSTEDSNTNLHEAVARGEFATVQKLIQSGADVNTKNFDKATPLHIATEKGYLPIVEFLLESGANASALDFKNNTPLHIAAEKGYLPIIRLLVKSGANVNALNRESITPLNYAVINQHLSTAELLIELGSDVNKTGRFFDNFTPLHSAVESESFPMVELLIRSGAHLNAKDSDYKNTPLDLALKKGYLRIADLLIHAGANLNSNKLYDLFKERIEKTFQNTTFDFNNTSFEKFDRFINLFCWYIYNTCTGTLKLSLETKVELIHLLKTSYNSPVDTMTEEHLVLRSIITYMLYSKSKKELIDNIVSYLNDAYSKNQKTFVKYMGYFFSQEELFKEFNNHFNTKSRNSFNPFKKKFSLKLLKNIENIFRYEYAQELKRKIFNPFDEKTIDELINLNTTDHKSEHTHILSTILTNLMNHCNDTKIKSSFIKTMINSTNADKDKEISTFSKAEIDNLLKIIKDAKLHLDYIIEQEGDFFNSPTSFGSNPSKDILY